MLKLRKFLNEQLVDQIPVLGGMLRALEEMSMMTGDVNIATNNPFIVQQLPEIRARIMNGKNWNAIAKYQVDNFFTQTVEAIKEEMSEIMKLYNSNVYDDFMEEPKCAGCGEAATQRCSRCKEEWYCGRECQLKRWKQHKEMCGFICNQLKEAEKLINAQE